MEQNFFENTSNNESEEQRTERLQKEVRDEGNELIVQHQQNEAKREELTKLYDRIQTSMNEPNTSPERLAELEKMRGDIDSQILKLNEEDRILNQKLRPF